MAVYCLLCVLSLSEIANTTSIKKHLSKYMPSGTCGFLSLPGGEERKESHLGKVSGMCMCVCVCIDVCACICVCMYVFLCESACVYMYVCMCV